jgi:hypothetical protein
MSALNPVEPFLRSDRIPHIWCPGCGIGTTVNCFARSLIESKIDLDSVAVVSGIGCTGRVAGYVKLDSFHTTHGRAIPFATGLKLANPKLNVVVYSGDGDLSAIGGIYSNHIAAANRPDIFAKLAPVSLGISTSLLIVLVPMSFFGIPMLGLRSVGAALASVFALIIGLFITRIIVKKLLGIRWNPRIFLYLIAVLFDVVVLVLLGGIWKMERWYDLIGLGLVSLSAFSLGLYFLKELEREDVKYFIDVINPKKMMSYISIEMFGKNRGKKN